MKRTTILCTAMLMAGTVSMAQTTDMQPAEQGAAHSYVSKNNHEVLPQAKDWALGISATGFLSWIGNAMNGNTMNSTPVFGNANGPDAFAIGNISGVALSGKYMKTATFAYRGRFQVNAGQNTYRNMVLKSLPTPDPLNPEAVEDNMTSNSYVVLLSGGFEKRRGTGRVQGFYGAEALVGVAGMNRSYTYGNKFSDEFTSVATTTDFINGSSTMMDIRNHASSTGASFLAGVRGICGVEYFIAPKMSLGGEIGYTLGFSTAGKGFTTLETWSAAEAKTVTINSDNYTSGGLRSMGIGLDNVNAGINLHFYF